MWEFSGGLWLFISSMFEFISKGEGLRVCKLAMNSAMRKSHREPMNGLEIIQPSGRLWLFLDVFFILIFVLYNQ